MAITKEQKAVLRYLKMAPRKVRLVADLIRGLPVNEAEARLLMSGKRPAAALLKLLRSATASAKHNNRLNPEHLFVKQIKVDQGPMLKRYIARAMGRATPIQKKSSHITLILAESEKPKPPRFKIVKPEKISKKEKAERIKRAKEERGSLEGPREQERETAKSKEKTGFIRRIFRRKAV